MPPRLEPTNAAIGRFGPGVLRTTPVRLALTFGLVMLGGLLLLNSLIFINASRYLERQGDGIVLGQAQILAALPIERLPDRISEAERADLRGVNHFGLFDAQDRWRAGSITSWPEGLPVDGQPRALKSSGFQYGARAVGVSLEHEYRLAVAYDAKTLSGLADIVQRAVAASSILSVILAMVLGVFLGLGPLRRLLRVQAASAQIAHGDLSQRLPVSAAGDELDMLAELVNQMVGQIQELLEEVKSVGDNIAHDLRAPLGSLRTHLLHCLQEWERLDEPSRLVDVELALKSTDALLTKFRALQRIAQLDSRERYSGMQPCELGDLLEDLAESHEALAENCGVDFRYTFDSNLMVLADRELVAEAFINLLDNAFKFTPRWGRVRCVLEVEDDCAVVSLIDTGPGIAEAELSEVMRRRVRGYHAQNVPGSGLGLAIVQAVVRLHGWQLELSNCQPGSGLNVRLIAPLLLPVRD